MFAGELHGHSLFYVGGTLGLAVAFAAGGYALTLHTDFLSTENLEVERSDPLWVGAWWLNYLIGSVVMLLISFALAGFPKDLPGADSIREENIKGKDDIEKEVSESHTLHLADIPKFLLDLLKNKTYVCMLVYGVCDTLVCGGFSAFGPKYFETQFRLTPTFAGAVFGIAIIPGAVGGLLTGGIIIKRWKLELKGILKVFTGFNVVLLVTSTMFFLRCEPIAFSGVNISYDQNSTIEDTSSLLSQCNANCFCGSTPFNPVCGVDSRLYYSPCHAGCSNYTLQKDGKKEYFGCDCITIPSSNLTNSKMAFEGTCEGLECQKMPIFVVLLLISMFALFVNGGMEPSITMRSLPHNQRLAGQGLHQLLVKVMGCTTGPLLFGYAFDAACLQREHHCGTSGECLSYDNWSIALNLFLVVTIVKGISTIAGLIALNSSQHRPRKQFRKKGCTVVAQRLANIANDDASTKVFLGDSSQSIET